MIDASWEIRNMGIKTAEINVEHFDSPQSVSATLEKVEEEYEYIVVRIPVRMLGVNVLMMERGYIFTETMLKIRGDADVPERARKICQKLRQNVEIAEVDEVDDIIAEIRKGMFKTDRVSLEFGEGLSAKRYEGWFKDVVKKDTVTIFQFFVNKKRSGFIVVDIDGPQMNVPLGGVYKDFQGLGYGLHYIVAIKMSAERLRVKDIKTTVSTNNLEVVKIYTFMGFWVEHPVQSK